MLRYPIPLILAALIATTAVVVYLTLDVRPVVPVVDENFTGTLFNGSVYLWRGAAGSLTFYPDGGDIEVAYFVPAYVIYLNGPPGNVTIRDGLHMLSSRTLGTWLVYIVKLRSAVTDEIFPAELTFKLVPVDVGDNLTVYVPTYLQPGRYYDVLELIRQNLGGITPNFVRDIQVNSTHVVIKTFASDGTLLIDGLYPIPGYDRINDGSAYTYRFSGVGFSYRIGNSTISGFAMPYAYFIIKPLADTRVTITVD
jgi:hypothetical protein